MTTPNPQTAVDKAAERGKKTFARYQGTADQAADAAIIAALAHFASSLGLFPEMEVEL